MYIINERKGVINLNCYPRIDVVEDNNNYLLVAFIKAEQDNEQSQNKYYYKHSITIMKFVTEVDAKYCLWHLYRSISNDKKTWEPGEIYLPSKAWETLIEKFCEKSKFESHKLLSDTTLKCEGSRKIVVSHNNIGGSLLGRYG